MALLALLLPVLCGIAFPWWAMGTPREASRRVVLAIALGPALGVALSSYVYFLLKLVLELPDAWYIAADTLFFLSLLAFLLIARSSADGETAFPRPTAIERVSPPRLLLVSFGVALVFCCATFVAITLVDPHGVVDSWSIWNLHARFMYLAGSEGWTEIGRIKYAQPDYPLLVPGAIARLWFYLGEPSQVVPALMALLFSASTVILLTATTALLNGRIVGLSAGALFMTNHVFFQHGASQCADVPLAFFILATVLLFALGEMAQKGAVRLIVVSGTVAALAVWTKNEGLPFFVLALLARFFMGVGTRTRAQRWREVGLFLVGALPGLMIVMLFKGWFAPPNSYSPGLIPNYILSCLIDPSRYTTIVAALWDRLGQLNLIPGIMVCFLPFFFGVTKVPQLRRTGIVTLSLVLTMGLAYFMIYVITPAWFDLEWTVRVSSPRLLHHLWPALIFGISMLVQRPRKALPAQDSAGCAGLTERCPDQ